MNLKEKFKQLAEDRGWRFVYARRDYQNLHEVTDFISDQMQEAGQGETVLFLDPIVRRREDVGQVRHSGNFMVLTQSDLDDSYDDRTKNYIDPLINDVMGGLANELRCDFDIDEWVSIELINIFDFNADGISVRFNLRGY